MLCLVFSTTLSLFMRGQHFLFFFLNTFGDGKFLFFEFIEVTNQNTFLKGPRKHFLLILKSEYISFESWQQWYLCLHWFSRCFKFSMLYGEKTPRERKKETCHNEQLQEGMGERCLTLQVKCISHILSFFIALLCILFPDSTSGTSDQPPPLWQGLCMSVTFPFHSHTAAFVIPCPSDSLSMCFVSQFYNPHLQGVLFSLHQFLYQELSAYVYSPTTSSAIQYPEKMKEKKRSSNLRIVFVVFMRVFMPYLLLKFTVRHALWIFLFNFVVRTIMERM